jgi:lysophospholipase L1-like esterase
LAQQVKHEPIEWSDIWIANANKDDRPRILLVGDSITKGYYPAVETRLSGKANCARYATSKFLGDPDYLAELSLILKRYKFDVIQINNGLHGLDYTEKEYKEALRNLLVTIKRRAPKAKLIWCTTTPVRAVKNLAQFNSEQNNRVIERNRIAAGIMNHHKIPIINLYEVVKDHPEYFEKDGVHFNDKGKIVQAKSISEAIAKSLSDKTNAGNGK